jgi:hypothetical protein
MRLGSNNFHALSNTLGTCKRASEAIDRAPLRPHGISSNILNVSYHYQTLVLLGAVSFARVRHRCSCCSQDRNMASSAILRPWVAV